MNPFSRSLGPPVVWALFVSLVFAPDALAYFDPASGSLVLQMILGGIAGVAVIVKLYWHKLLDFLGVERPSYGDDDEGEDVADQADADQQDEIALDGGDAENDRKTS